MILKSLTLNNFRQFVDEQIINFSTSKDKKVTLVTAASGAGKTTIINALSWAFYGSCDYTNVLNSKVSADLAPDQEITVSCDVEFSHDNSNYLLSRHVKFTKNRTKVTPGKSYLNIKVKGSDGQTKGYCSPEADFIIKKVIPKDLFSYFYLKGEHLTTVGRSMSKGASGEKSPFVSAMKQLLGISYLDDVLRYLNNIKKDFDEEIRKSNNDYRLQNVIDKLNDFESKCQQNKEKIEKYKDEIEKYQIKLDEISVDISANGDALPFQTEIKEIQRKIPELKNELDLKKKQLMSEFSSKGIYLLMNQLIPACNETLKDVSNLKEGRHGIKAEAIQKILDDEKCICGCSIPKGSDAWNQLRELMRLLPPNNIGVLVNNFQNNLEWIPGKAEDINENLMNLRRDINSIQEEIEKLEQRKQELDDALSGTSKDVSKLKQTEKEYDDKISELKVQIGIADSENRDNYKEMRELKAQKEELIKENNSLRILNIRKQATTWLIDQFNSKKNELETDSQASLKEAINDIFKKFYKEQVEFELTDNYGIRIKTADQDSANDFTSGGQDVAIALAFIGGIINFIKQNNINDNEGEKALKIITRSTEFPLVLDAPVSNFGMAQIKSFCETIPDIVDQLIILTNDRDSKYIKNDMDSIIGSKYNITKVNTYQSFIQEGEKNA